MTAHLTRLLLVVGSLCCFAAAVLASCISENVPDAGTIVLVNESPDSIAWVRGFESEGIEGALGAVSRHVIIPPGKERKAGYSFGINVEKWCESNAAMHWIVRPIVETRWTSEGIPLSLDAVDVLETLGPGHCWSERHDTYKFNGN